MNVEEASSRLTNWVLQTGKSTSRTVTNDLATHSNQVERQTRSIVAWIASRERLDPPKAAESRSHLSRTEVDQVLKCVEPLPLNERSDYAAFALHFLRYSKLHGVASAQGWEAMVAVDGVMKRWPNCRSSNKYRRKLDFFMACGLIEQTREKRQSTNGAGRPRTYLIRIAPVAPTETSLSVELALAYAAKFLASSNSEQSHETSFIDNNDGYKGFVKPISKRVSDSKMEAALISHGVAEGQWPSLASAGWKHFSLADLAKESAKWPLSPLPLNKYKLKVEGPQSLLAQRSVVDASIAFLDCRPPTVFFSLHLEALQPQRGITRSLADTLGTVPWHRHQGSRAKLRVASQELHGPARPRPPTFASGSMSRTASYCCNSLGRFR
jgi:hypothetical protein